MTFVLLCLNTNHRLCFSELSSVPGSAATDVQLFRDYITANYNSGVMFRQPTTNHIVVSTFSGENSTFGQGSMESGWAYLKAELNKITPVCWSYTIMGSLTDYVGWQIFLIPSFFINPSRFASIAAIDGAFNVRWQREMLLPGNLTLTCSGTGVGQSNYPPLLRVQKL